MSAASDLIKRTEQDSKFCWFGLTYHVTCEVVDTNDKGQNSYKVIDWREDDANGEIRRKCIWTLEEVRALAEWSMG